MKLSLLRVLGMAIAMVMLLAAQPVLAAPTCQDRDGFTTRCGTSGAMPVGWTLPFEERAVVSPGPSTGQLLKLIAVLVLFLALSAHLPEFDGRRAGDWDKQESDG